MDSTGATGARFRSELVIGNIDQSQPMMLYQETWLGNLLQIPARTEIRAADALEFLNSVGIPAGPGSSLSLICGPVPFTCQTEGYYALSRVYTNSPGGGSYGVMLEAPTDIDGADEEGTVYGLQFFPGVDRSNLVVSQIPDRGSKEITLEVTVFASDGTPAPKVLTAHPRPGRWWQWNQVLREAGLPEGVSGYARIRRWMGGLAGNGPWWAYGVINDEATSDGSLLPVFRPGGIAAVRKQIVPVVLDARGASGSHYTTEITLANDSPLQTAVELVYHASAASGPGGRYPAVSVSLSAREQRIIPNILEFLREQGLMIPESSSGPQAGTLTVWFRDLEGIAGGNTVVLARTMTPNPDRSIGGRFGVAYPATAWGRGARTSALVPALAEDSSRRTNLAVVHTGGGSEGPLTLSVQLRDARTGNDTGPPLTVTLEPGEWYQWTHILEQAGVTTGQATAVITRVAGDDTFLAYGIVNDAVTSDGSYIKMIRLDAK